MLPLKVVSRIASQIKFVSDSFNSRLKKSRLQSMILFIFRVDFKHKAKRGDLKKFIPGDQALFSYQYLEESDNLLFHPKKQNFPLLDSV
ncbi:hypothetical protein DsansV1_C01g0009861 [Dioscorea sansibarensis]